MTKLGLYVLSSGTHPYCKAVIYLILVWRVYMNDEVLPGGDAGFAEVIVHEHHEPTVLPQHSLLQPISLSLNKGVV